MSPDAHRSGVVDLDPKDPDARRQVDELLSLVAEVSGHPAMGEPSLLAWRAGTEADDLVHRDGTVDGYARLERHGTSVTVEVVVAPGRQEARRALLSAGVARASRPPTTEVRHWIYRHTPADDDAPLSLGFHVERDLLQLRAPLPLAVERPEVDRALVLRTFVPGTDEAAWLEVNNRAFAAHPEQGAWDLETLRRREGAPWFDPDGFVLVEVDGRLAGSCWTKVHRDHEPVLGEIYVISVDPAFQGRGLGRILAVAGLDWLTAHAEVGMLYVDRANDGALALYDSLGFVVDHVDRCYLLEPGRPGGAAGG